MRSVLLLCGAAAAVVYAAMNVVVPLWWPGYSHAAQAVSELSAIDAPTRAIWVPFGALYTLLVIAFGLGVFRAAASRGALRVVGATLVVSGAIGLWWPPMHQRAVIAAGGATLTDTLHLVWTGATVLLMIVGIVASAVAFGPRFRRYAFATLALLTAGALMTSVDAARLDAGLPTPWMGVYERLNIGVYLLWLATLSVTLLREPGVRGAGPTSGR